MKTEERRTKNEKRRIRRGLFYVLRFSFFVPLAACATAPPAAPPAPAVTYEQKLSWILRLEDQRILREALPPPAPPPPPPRRGASAAPAPPPRPDLTRLLGDAEARVRRRAALAIGRVGLPDGVDPLVAMLADQDEEVRQMAAFALGLIGDRSAIEPLIQALSDPSPIVQGRAAEALGLIGDASAGAAIGAMVTGHLKSEALAAGRLQGDDLSYPLSPGVEAVRLGVYALARLKAYEPLAGAVLDPQGQPRVRWWPVAYALQRIEDKRARPALLALATDPSVYTASFAIRGLGVLKDPSAFEVVHAAFRNRRQEPPVLVAAIRALGQIGDPRAAPDLLAFLRLAGVDPNLRVEALGALGSLKAPDAGELLMDLMGELWPTLRAAAMRALAVTDPETFITVLSGMDPDEHWSVRAALASTLGELTPEMALPRLTVMLSDPDQRVLPSVLASLAKLKAPDVVSTLRAQLKNTDVVVRTVAARLLGELKPGDGLPPLEEAYRLGAGDATYLARAAVLDALAKYGQPATATLKAALADRDWAVRVRAVALLKALDPTSNYAAEIRPAPMRLPPDAYQASAITAPAYSTHAYIDTDKGTIQIELAMLDAPLSVENFVTLARRGFFNGLRIHRVVPNFVVQDGDPRGDSEGGPGYTIRDELSQLPYLRGTVGMALDWADTGGSQFFITHSPQPHLDARYTVFGRVVAGIEVVDRILQWDTIQRVRIWDGATATGGAK